MTELINTQQKRVKIAIVPTWVLAHLNERQLPVESILDPDVRNSIFSIEDLHILQAANGDKVSSVILGSRTPDHLPEKTNTDSNTIVQLSPCACRPLYNFTHNALWYNHHIQQRVNSLHHDYILFGTMLPDDYHYDVDIKVLDDDDHLDVLVTVVPKEGKLHGCELRNKRKDNLDRISDALYVRNFPLCALTSIGLFQI